MKSPSGFVGFGINIYLCVFKKLEIHIKVTTRSGQIVANHHPVSTSHENARLKITQIFLAATADSNRFSGSR